MDSTEGIQKRSTSTPLPTTKRNTALIFAIIFIYLLPPYGNRAFSLPQAFHFCHEMPHHFLVNRFSRNHASSLEGGADNGAVGKNELPFYVYYIDATDKYRMPARCFLTLLMSFRLASPPVYLPVTTSASQSAFAFFAESLIGIKGFSRV